MIDASVFVLVDESERGFESLADVRALKLRLVEPREALQGAHDLFHAVETLSGGCRARFGCGQASCHLRIPLRERREPSHQGVGGFQSALDHTERGIQLVGDAGHQSAHRIELSLEKHLGLPFLDFYVGDLELHGIVNSPACPARHERKERSDHGQHDEAHHDDARVDVEVVHLGAHRSMGQHESHEGQM